MTRLSLIRTLALACGAASLAVWAACEPLEPLPAGDTTVDVRLTATGAERLEAAVVDISAVEMVHENGSVHTLSADALSAPLDLLDPQELYPLRLAEGTVPEGVYRRLRVTVDSVEIQLRLGLAFTGGGTTRSLPIPTAAQSGIGLNLEPGGGTDDEPAGMRIVPGQTVLILAFDLRKSILLEDDPDVDGAILDATFDPALRVVARDVAGAVEGAVSGSGAAGRVVTALPLDNHTLEPFQTEGATTAVGSDGGYTLEWLVPGTYAISVETGDSLTTQPTLEQVTVAEGETVSNVDFLLVTGTH